MLITIRYQIMTVDRVKKTNFPWFWRTDIMVMWHTEEKAMTVSHSGCPDVSFLILKEAVTHAWENVSL